MCLCCVTMNMIMKGKKKEEERSICENLMEGNNK